MSLLFSNENHTATLHSGEHAAASVVHDDWPVLDCKITNFICNLTLRSKKSAKNKQVSEKMAIFALNNKHNKDGQ